MEAFGEMIGDLFRWICDQIDSWRDRRRIKRQDHPTKCHNCQHSLEGSLEAGLPRCPECGQKIPRWKRVEWVYRGQGDEKDKS